jgi:hypothetical protein
MQNVEVTEEFVECRGKETKFLLLKGFKKEVVSYTDGIFYYFTSRDSSMFVVHCGGMHQTPLLQGHEYQITRIENKGRQGTKNDTNLYWRELNLGFVNIYYDHIKSDKKEYFDRLLEALTEKMSK